MTSENDDLLNALLAQGCSIKTAEGGSLVSLPDDYDEFIFERMGEWLYIGTTLLTVDELLESEHAASLDRFLLNLQHRNLGCHFSYDAAGYLTIGTVLNPDQQLVDEVLHTMEHICYVIDVCLPFCDLALQSGAIALDAEVDQAFGISEQLH